MLNILTSRNICIEVMKVYEMADETLFDFLHSEIVNYGVEMKKGKEGEEVIVTEGIGFSVGYRVMERLTREWPRFKDELDTVKFICTDFWSCIYKKQIDNLRTNHQGIYMMQDNAFRFLTKFSNGQQYLEYAPRVSYTVMYIDRIKYFLSI